MKKEQIMLVVNDILNIMRFINYIEFFLYLIKSLKIKYKNFVSYILVKNKIYVLKGKINKKSINTLYNIYNVLIWLFYVENNIFKKYIKKKNIKEALMVILEKITNGIKNLSYIDKFFKDSLCSRIFSSIKILNKSNKDIKIFISMIYYLITIYKKALKLNNILKNKILILFNFKIINWGCMLIKKKSNYKKLWKYISKHIQYDYRKDTNYIFLQNWGNINSELKYGNSKLYKIKKELDVLNKINEI